MSPTTRVGTAVAMNIKPTDSADPVARKTRMPAARSVSAVPIVETSCADHNSRKSRLRKTENVLAVPAPGFGCPSGPGPDVDPAAGSLTLAASVTDRSLYAPRGRRHFLRSRPSVPKARVLPGRDFAPAAGKRPGSASRGSSRQLDTFQREQLALDLQQRFSRSEPAPAVAADRAVAGDDAVAWDGEPDRVAADRAAGRTSRAGPADPARDLAIARNRSPWDLAHAAEDR